MVKSSPSIWHLLHNVKYVDGEDFLNFMAFLENKNFTTSCHKETCKVQILWEGHKISINLPLFLDNT